MNIADIAHEAQCWDRNFGFSFRDTAFKCVCVIPQPIAEDDINHPTHYTSHPTKVECIDIVEHMNFNLGNAIKYVWRAGLKSPDVVKDLRKAAWYIDREIKRLNGKEDSPEEHRTPSGSTADGTRQAT
jgi:hypothetical protein